jgi:flagellar hook-basal body complex protein FliE
MRLPGITPVAPVPAIEPPAGQRVDRAGAAFSSVFAAAVAEVDGLQRAAQASLERFLAGEGEELHQVALASKQAELAFELFLAVRNKVVAAYEEVMRMQV